MFLFKGGFFVEVDADVFYVMSQGYCGEGDSGLCRVRRTTVVRPTRQLFSCLNLDVRSVGFIQVRSEHALGF